MWILVISRRSSFKFPTSSYFVNVNFNFILRDRYCMIFMLKLYLCHRKRKINKQTKKHNSQRVISLKACTNKCKFWSLFMYLFIYLIALSLSIYLSIYLYPVCMPFMSNKAKYIRTKKTFFKKLVKIPFLRTLYGLTRTKKFFKKYINNIQR